ncbi:MAG: DUF3638 domain-containing protein [Chlamydiota bacterium]
MPFFQEKSRAHASLIAKTYQTVTAAQAGSLGGRALGKITRVVNHHLRFAPTQIEQYRLAKLLIGLQATAFFLLLIGGRAVPNHVIIGVLSANTSFFAELTRGNSSLLSIARILKTFCHWVDQLKIFLEIPLSALLAFNQTTTTSLLGGGLQAGIVLSGGHQLGTLAAQFTARFISSSTVHFLQSASRKAFPFISSAAAVVIVALVMGAATGAALPTALLIAAQDLAIKQAALKNLFFVAMAYGFLNAPVRQAKHRITSHHRIIHLKPTELDPTTIWGKIRLSVSSFFGNPPAKVASSLTTALFAEFVPEQRTLFENYATWVSQLEEFETNTLDAHEHFDVENVINRNPDPKNLEKASGSHLIEMCKEKIRTLEVNQSLMLPALSWDRPLFFVLTRSALNQYQLTVISEEETFWDGHQQVTFTLNKDLSQQTEKDFLEKAFPFFFAPIHKKVTPESLTQALKTKLKAAEQAEQPDFELESKSDEKVLRRAGDQHWIDGLSKVAKLLDSDPSKHHAHRASFQARLFYCFNLYQELGGQLEDKPEVCAQLNALCATLSSEFIKLSEQDSDFAAYSSEILAEIAEMKRVIAKAEKNRTTSLSLPANNQLLSPMLPQLSCNHHKSNEQQLSAILQPVQEKPPVKSLIIEKNARLLDGLNKSKEDEQLPFLIAVINDYYQDFILDPRPLSPDALLKATDIDTLVNFTKKLAALVKSENRLPYSHEVAAMNKLVMLVDLADKNLEHCHLLPYALHRVFGDSRFESVTFPKDPVSMHQYTGNQCFSNADFCRSFHMQPYNGVRHFRLFQENEADRAEAIFKKHIPNSDPKNSEIFIDRCTDFEKTVLDFFTSTRTSQYTQPKLTVDYLFGSHFVDRRMVELVDQPLEKKDIVQYGKDPGPFYELLRAYSILPQASGIAGANKLAIKNYGSQIYGNNTAVHMPGGYGEWKPFKLDSNSKATSLSNRYQETWSAILSHHSPIAAQAGPLEVIDRNLANYQSKMKQLGVDVQQVSALKKLYEEPILKELLSLLTLEQSHVLGINLLEKKQKLFSDPFIRNFFETALFDLVGSDPSSTLLTRPFFYKKLAGRLGTVMTQARQEGNKDLFLFTWLIARRFRDSGKILEAESSSLLDPNAVREINKTNTRHVEFSSGSYYSPSNQEATRRKIAKLSLEESIGALDAILRDKENQDLLAELAQDSKTAYRALTEQMMSLLDEMEQAKEVNIAHFLSVYFSFKKVVKPSQDFDPSEYAAIENRSLLLINSCKEALKTCPKEKRSSCLNQLCFQVGINQEQLPPNKNWKEVADEPLCYELEGVCRLDLKSATLTLTRSELSLASLPKSIEHLPTYQRAFKSCTKTTVLKKKTEDQRTVYFIYSTETKELLGQVECEGEKKPTIYKKMKGKLYQFSACATLDNGEYLAQLGFPFVYGIKENNKTRYFTADREENFEFELLPNPTLRKNQGVVLKNLANKEQYVLKPFAQLTKPLKKLLQLAKAENIVLFFDADNPSELKKVRLQSYQLDFEWDETKQALYYSSDAKGKLRVMLNSSREILPNKTLQLEKNHFLVVCRAEKSERIALFKESAPQHYESCSATLDEQVEDFLSLTHHALEMHAVIAARPESSGCIDVILQQFNRLIESSLGQDFKARTITKLVHFLKSPITAYQQGPFLYHQIVNQYIVRLKLNLQLMSKLKGNQFAMARLTNTLAETAAHYYTFDLSYRQVANITPEERQDIFIYLLTQGLTNPSSLEKFKSIFLVECSKKDSKINEKGTLFWQAAKSAFANIQQLTDNQEKFRDFLNEHADNGNEIPKDSAALDSPKTVANLKLKQLEKELPKKQESQEKRLITCDQPLSILGEEMRSKLDTWFEPTPKADTEDFTFSILKNNPNSLSSAEKASLIHVQNSVQAYYNSLADNHKFADKSSLKDIKTTLKKRKAQLKLALIKKKQQIINEQHRQINDEADNQGTFNLKLAAGKKHARTLSQLQIDFAFNNIAQPKMKKLLQTYCKLKVELHLIQAADNLNLTDQEEWTKEKTDTLYEILSRKREYDPKNHPALLVFEAETGQVLRKLKTGVTQGELIDQLLHASKGLNVAPTGAGKTTVLNVLNALLRANGTNLVSVAVTPTLFAEAKQVLKDTLESSFDRHVYSFDFDLRTNDTEHVTNFMGNPHKISRFQLIYEDLLLAITQKKCLLRDYKSIGLLRAKLILLLNERANNKIDPMSDQHILYLQNIFCLLHEREECTYDEPDAKCQSNQRLRVIVNEGKNADKVALPQFMINQSIQFFNELMKCETLGLQHDNQKKQGTDAIREEALTQIAHTYAEQYAEIAQIPKETILQYLLGKNQIDDQGTLSDQQLGNLSLLKDLIATVLPITLAKESGSDYKRKNVNSFSKIETVPCHSGRIQKSSSFGNPLERICYTIQSFIQNKVTAKELFLWLKHLKSELNLNDLQAISEVKRFSQSARLNGDKKQILINLVTQEKLKHYTSLSDDQKKSLETIASSLKWPIIQEYFVWPILQNIRLPNNVIEMTAYDLVGLSNKCLGISATTGGTGFQFPEAFRRSHRDATTIKPAPIDEVWKMHSPSKALQQQIDGCVLASEREPNLTLGKMVAELLDKSKNSPQIRANDGPNSQGNADAIVDLGGLYRLTPPREMAQSILNNSSATHVSYIAANGKRKKVTHNDSQLPKKQQRTGFYYAQAQARGTDATLDANAHFVITVESEGLTLSKLLQGVGRSRKSSQKISFMCHNSDGKLKNKTSQELLTIAIRNTVKIEANQVYRGQTIELDAQLRQKSWEELINLQGNQVSVDRTVRHFKNALRPIFIQSTAHNYPNEKAYWEKRGTLPDQSQTKEVLKSKVALLNQRAEKVGFKPFIKRQGDENQQDMINQYMPTRVNNVLKDDDFGIEVENEQLVEQQNQNEDQIEQQNENEYQIEQQNENEYQIEQQNENEQQVNEQLSKKIPLTSFPPWVRKVDYNKWKNFQHLRLFGFPEELVITENFSQTYENKTRENIQQIHFFSRFNGANEFTFTAAIGDVLESHYIFSDRGQEKEQRFLWHCRRQKDLGYGKEYSTYEEYEEHQGKNYDNISRRTFDKNSFEISYDLSSDAILSHRNFSSAKERHGKKMYRCIIIAKILNGNYEEKHFHGVSGALREWAEEIVRNQQLENFKQWFEKEVLENNEILKKSFKESYLWKFLVTTEKAMN